MKGLSAHYTKKGPSQRLVTNSVTIKSGIKSLPARHTKLSCSVQSQPHVCVRFVKCYHFSLSPGENNWIKEGVTFP